MVSLKNIPILWKVISLLLLLGVAAASVGVYAARNLVSVASNYDAMIGGPAQGAMQLARANRWILATNAAIYRNIVESTDDGNRAAMAEQKEAVEGFNKLANEAKQLVPKYGDAIDRVMKEFDQTITVGCAKSIDMANAATSADGTAQAMAELKKNCIPRFQSVVSNTKQLVDMLVADNKVTSNGLSVAAAQATFYTYLALFISLAIVLMIAVVLTVTNITSPLKALVVAMGKMSQGDLNVDVAGGERKDEIGTVARTLEVFRASLNEGERLRLEAQESEKVNAEKVRLARHQIADEFQSKMGALAESFGKSSHEVSEAARNLAATAEETARQAQAVSGAAEQASVNVQTVAASTEEMTASVREIAGQVSKSNAVANSAASEAARTEGDVRALSEAATKIGEVVELINNIASQTNLLALNATIEAARAGEAGKGFAVVASEVKQLAAQTAKATEEISSKINEIQQATNRTVGSIDRIVNTVSDIQSISTMISAAIEEQGAATGEIASNTQLAAHGTEQVSDNINGVGRAAEMTGAASTQLMSLSGALSVQAANMQQDVAAFVQQLRAG